MESVFPFGYVASGDQFTNTHGARSGHSQYGRAPHRMARPLTVWPGPSQYGRAILWGGGGRVHSLAVRQSLLADFTMYISILFDFCICCTLYGYIKQNADVDNTF